MLLGSFGFFLALFLLLAPHMPAEQADPRAHLSHTPPTSPRRAALIGGSLTLIPGVLWASLTQTADTAGASGSSPQGFLYYIPALFVLLLLGAGLGVYINYIRVTRQA